MGDTPYNANSELVAMKEDIANRKFNVKLKGLLIGGAMLVGGVAAGGAMAAAYPAALPAMAGMGKLIVYGATAAGGAIIGLATMREVKKLEMDEKYLESYMQGKNYWGEGYREEVLEHGYSGPSLPMSAPPPDRFRGAMHRG